MQIEENVEGVVLATLLTSKTTQTRPQVSSVQCGKILPNLVNSSWLW